MSTRIARSGVIATALAAAALLLLVVANSVQWVGTNFPGFFVMANRVVPSITLSNWPDPSPLFQHQVVAVDGVPVSTAEALYERVRAQTPGTRFQYTVRRRDGTLHTEEVESGRFSLADYALLFGAYILNGVAFIGIGLVVWWVKPRKAASYGLLGACLVVGVFILTAVDLYGPHWFFRLHILAEAMGAAGFIHLALVFPTDRIPHHRVPALLGVYVPFGALAIVYQSVLLQPSAYSKVHIIASSTFGICAASIVGSVVYELLTAQSQLVQRRIAIVALGTLVGILPITLLWAASGVFGGQIALNAVAMTAFFFPLSIAYTIVKQDLFEIDAMLRRAMTYTVVVMAVAVLYFAVLLLFGALVPSHELLVYSPAALALLNLTLMFLISSVRERVQALIDRVFFRKGYDVEGALSTLSRCLASARTIDQVVEHTHELFATTIYPEQTRMFLRRQDGRYRAAALQDGPPIELPSVLGARLDAGDVLTRYEWREGNGRSLPAVWYQFNAELLVPICMSGTVIALLALGAKGSGYPYNMHDIAFMRTAANQIALAVTNAAAFGQLGELNKHLEHLNENLERQVEERTAALHNTNQELNRSLDKLQLAYQQLEQNQASLLRADRLATLGRLTAGLAHEMNTPLSAVLNALKIITDLGREYETAIEDPEIAQDDHRGIANEIVSNALAATQWTHKATGFIRSVKAHGREARPTTAERFLVRDSVADTCDLVAHRLRAASCRVDLEDEAVPVSLIGDPGRLSQVLVNLLTNAIDAYEERGILDGRIEIRATRTNGAVRIRVRDWAGGIPDAVLPHIFEELYTTKGPGRGTGLGLWIARNVVEEGFGGTLNVLTTSNGSCFTAEIPTRASMAYRIHSPPREREPAGDGSRIASSRA